MSTAYSIRRRFVPGSAGDLYVTEYLPEKATGTHVLLFPPFAEEMNRARRMLTLQARMLVEHGLQVSQPDLFGTGDSDGDFGDATWDTWISDLQTVMDAVSADSHDQLVLLGVRLGALLAADAVRRHAVHADRLCFWSPCVNGELYMTQFLRLRRMAGMLAGRSGQESITDLRATLQSGRSLEVAGYSLSPALVAAVDSLRLADCLDASAPPVDWIEVIADSSRPLSPQASRTADELTNRGVSVRTMAIQGPPFWSTAEISVSHEVLEATGRLLAQGESK